MAMYTTFVGLAAHVALYNNRVGVLSKALLLTYNLCAGSHVGETAAVRLPAHRAGAPRFERQCTGERHTPPDQETHEILQGPKT